MKTESTSQSVLIGLFVVLAFATCTLPALGQTCSQTTTWTDSTGDWFTDGNWSSHVPCSTTDASINNGGEAELSDPNTRAYALSLTLGQNQGQSGTLLVDVTPNTGYPNLWVHGPDGIVVGSRGTGNMSIINGGFVGTTGPASIASMSGSNGTVSVNGHASTWGITAVDGNPSQLSIGGTQTAQGGTAVLSVKDGGTVELDDEYTQTWTSVTVWPSGTLTGNGLIVVVGGGNSKRNVLVHGTLAPGGASTTLYFSFGTNSNSTITLSSDATTECNVTAQDNPNSAQVNLLQGAVLLGGRLSVTMTGDYSSAPTRFLLLHADAGLNNTTFDSKSFKYPTGQGWSPQITYDYVGNNVYLDRVYYLGP